jgi:phosphohistidine phosphatase SixA
MTFIHIKGKIARKTCITNKAANMKQYILFVALLMITSSCTTTYFVVRHAEKLNNTENSPLSAAGLERANTLRDTLASKGIDSVFASVRLRTQQTAQPTAISAGATIQIFPIDPDSGLLGRLRRINGKQVLVVGHSNTVPQIVQSLSGKTAGPIQETIFDSMYIIKKTKFLSTKTTLRRTTYGRRTL